MVSTGNRVSTGAITRFTPEMAINQFGGARMVQRVDRQHRRVCSGIALHAYRMHRNDEAFLGRAERRVEFGAEAADGQSRSGERMPIQQFVRAARVRGPTSRTSSL